MNCPKCEVLRNDKEYMEKNKGFLPGVLVFGTMVTCTKCEYKSCIQQTCCHDASYHKEGACWFITQPLLKENKSNEEFCVCNKEGNIRLYKITGYIVIGLEDYMITRQCSICGKDVLLLKNQTTCNPCIEKEDRAKFIKSQK